MVGRPASRSARRTSPGSPNSASTSSGCRWITAAGPTRPTGPAPRGRAPRDRRGGAVRPRSMASTSSSTSTGPPATPLPARRSRRTSGPTPRPRTSARCIGDDFARRYRGIPSRELSFNLFNEPARVGPEAHRQVVERMVEAIREHDADRLIVCDGRDWGTTPPTELVGLGVAAATRGYAAVPPDPLPGALGRGVGPVAEADLPAPRGGQGLGPGRHCSGTRSSPGRPWKRRGSASWSASSARTTGRRTRSSCPGCATAWRLEGRGLGLGPLELPGQLRHPRQRPSRRRV